MVHMLDELRPEIGQHLLDAHRQQLFAFFVGVGHYEAIDMDQGHLLSFELLVIIAQHVQKLDSIHWQVHVDMVWLLELMRQRTVLTVDLAHCLPGTHVPAQHLIFDLVYFGVCHQVLVAVGVEIVRNHKQILLGCPHSQRAYSTKKVRQQLAWPHNLEDPIPLLLQPRTPVDLFEVDPELYTSFLQSCFIVDFARHVLERGSAINVMELLCLVDDCFYVGAFEKSDLPDRFFPLFLLFGEIVVSDVAYGLEAAWKMDVVGVFLIFDLGKPV